jgi:hypothetical protein
MGKTWLFQFSQGGGLVALWVLMDLGPREMGPTRIIRVAFSAVSALAFQSLTSKPVLKNRPLVQTLRHVSPADFLQMLEFVVAEEHSSPVNPVSSKGVHRLDVCPPVSLVIPRGVEITKD